jgi:hypothetical protein
VEKPLFNHDAFDFIYYYSNQDVTVSVWFLWTHMKVALVHKDHVRKVYRGNRCKAPHTSLTSALGGGDLSASPSTAKELVTEIWGSHSSDTVDVFCVVTSYGLVYLYQLFRGAYWLHFQGWNIVIYLQVHTVLNQKTSINMFTAIRISNFIKRFFDSRTHRVNISNNNKFQFNIIQINCISFTPPDSKRK